MKIQAGVQVSRPGELRRHLQLWKCFGRLYFIEIVLVRNISIDERALHKREYDSRVNERQMQTTEGKVDMSKAMDTSVVDIESYGTESGEQDTSSRLGNDAHANDADIKLIYDKEPMVENAEQFHDKHPLSAQVTENQITELLNQSLESENIWQHGQFLKEKSNEAKVKHDIDGFETINIELEYSMAKLLAENEQLHKEKEHLKQTYKDLFDSIKKTRVQTNEQNDCLIEQLNKKSIGNTDLKAQIQEKIFAIAALKNEFRKLKGTSMDTKFAKPSMLGKLILHSLINQSVVRQPTAFKSERLRISKPRFASQVDVKNDLSKPVTPHYLPKIRESAFKAKKKTHERDRNSKPSVMPSARSQSTTNDCNPKPRIDNQKSRNWPTPKTSCVTTKTVPIAEHSMDSKKISDSKHFACSTCQKCVFNANHDSRVTKFLNEVNSRAKVPTGKIFTSSTTKVNGEPPHGSNTNITNLHECIQNLDSSACTSINVQEEKTLDLSACTPFNVKNERIKAWIKENVISGRPRLHGITSIHDISARPKSQGILCLLTS
ncbi:hypothetical protein Tco_1327765 [Tanacetum coccineum]